MTLSEYASLHGLTRQALYKRMKQGGIKSSNIKRDDAGQLTEESVEVLDALLTGDNPVDTDDVNQLTQKVDTLTQQVDALTIENKALNTRIDGLQAQIDIYKAELEKAHQDAAECRIIAITAQRQTQALLPAPKVHWWQRIGKKRDDTIKSNL